MNKVILSTILMSLLGIMTVAAIQPEEPASFEITAESTTGDSSKKYVEATMRLEPFSQIKVDLVSNVRFEQSNKSRIVAEGPERIIKLLDVEVKGDVLKITAKKDYKLSKGEKLTLTIYSPTLNSVKLTGVGNFTAEDIETTSLAVINEGVGNIKVHDLHCQDVTVNLTGVGNVTIDGTAEEASFNSDGVGTIDAYDMEVKSAMVCLNGVGSVRCYASEQLDCFNNGVGSISFKGHPEKKDLRKNGVGSIREK